MTNAEMGNAFPRHARLLNASDYAAVFKQCRRYSSRFWTVLVHVDRQRPAQLGLAIAKKRAKRAVDRNRLKRIAREAFRHEQYQLVGKQLIVLNREGLAKVPSKDLHSELVQLLCKAGEQSPGTKR